MGKMTGTETEKRPIRLAGFMDVTEIPPSLDHGWEVSINGKLIPDVKILMVQSKRGKFVLAFRVKDGFASPLFTEKGGLVILPVSRTDDGVELVGGINEFRYNMDSDIRVLCALGGMRLEDEELCPTVKSKIHTKVPELSIKGINRYLEFMELVTDRLYKVASPDREKGDGGVSAFELPVDFDQLEKLPDGSYGLIGTNGKMQFWPIEDAAGKSADTLFLSLVLFRLTRLIKEGKFCAVREK